MHSNISLTLEGMPRNAPKLGLVCVEFRLGGELAMHQQMGDLLELTLVGDVEYVVATVMQIVAATADGTQRCVARGHAR